MDENLEIVVWYEESETIYGFQLCYDLRGQPRAVTWMPRHGFSHAAIDNGDDKATSNHSPVLRPCANYDAAKLCEAFSATANGLPAPEKTFVENKLRESAPSN